MPPKKAIKRVQLSNPLNFYELDEVRKLCNSTHNPNYEHHKIKVPFRMVIVGSSGAKKTNTLCNLIHAMNGTFEKIEVYTRNRDEPLYNFLSKKIGPDLTIREGLSELNKVDLNQKYSEKLARLIVFDDLCLEKNQSQIEELYIRGRKLNISLIYISQKYFNVPLAVRAQTNYIIIKKIADVADLKRIVAGSSLSRDVQTILKIYRYCTADSNGWLLIDLEAPSEDQYRHNFEVLTDDEIRQL